jgi:hypothetical protein
MASRLFSAVFSPLGLFTGPAGQRTNVNNANKKDAGGVGPSTVAGATHTGQASKTEDFAAVDDVVIDRNGGLFFRNPVTGERTPVKEEDDAAVRKMLRVRLLGGLRTRT